MSTGAEQQSPRERSVLHIVVVIVFVILAVWGLIAFRSARENQRALEKASELVQALEAAGSSAPRPEVIARVLGDDGGAVCANPNQAHDALVAQLRESAPWGVHIDVQTEALGSPFKAVIGSRGAARPRARAERERGPHRDRASRTEYRVVPSRLRQPGRLAITAYFALFS